MNNVENTFNDDGFIVEEDVLVTGYSGVKHYFPLLLSKEDKDIAVEFSDGSNIWLDVAKLIVKCRDSGIQNAILILNKNISVNEKINKMAKENGIKIIGSSNIKDVGRAG